MPEYTPSPKGNAVTVAFMATMKLLLAATYTKRIRVFDIYEYYK